MPQPAPPDKAGRKRCATAGEAGTVGGRDPVEQIIEAFELDGGQWRLIAAVEHDDPVQIPPFDAIRFRLGDLWD